MSDEPMPDRTIVMQAIIDWYKREDLHTEETLFEYALLELITNDPNPKRDKFIQRRITRFNRTLELNR